MLPFNALIADRAFDADWPLEDLGRRGAEAVTTPVQNRNEPREQEREVCGWRCRIENLFSRNNEIRAVATRCDKSGESFAAGIHLAASVIVAK